MRATEPDGRRVRALDTDTDAGHGRPLRGSRPLPGETEEPPDPGEQAPPGPPGPPTPPAGRGRSAPRRVAVPAAALAVVALLGAAVVAAPEPVPPSAPRSQETPPAGRAVGAGTGGDALPEPRWLPPGAFRSEPRERALAVTAPPGGALYVVRYPGAYVVSVAVAPDPAKQEPPPRGPAEGLYVGGAPAVMHRLDTPDRRRELRWSVDGISVRLWTSTSADRPGAPTDADLVLLGAGVLPEDRRVAPDAQALRLPSDPLPTLDGEQRVPVEETRLAGFLPPGSAVQVLDLPGGARLVHTSSPFTHQPVDGFAERARAAQLADLPDAPGPDALSPPRTGDGTRSQSVSWRTGSVVTTLTLEVPAVVRLDLTSTLLQTAARAR